MAEPTEVRFFGRLGLVLLVLTMAAFSTTYFLPVVAGRFKGPPILHLHGLTFLLWPLLFAVQARLATASRRWHRSLGLAGISLATAMVILGLAAIGSSIASWTERGVGLQGQAISVIAFVGLGLFAVFFTMGIAKVRDRAAHMRLMALSTLSIMQAASARLFLTLMLGGNAELIRPGLLAPPPLLPTVVPHLTLALPVLAAMAWNDRRTLGHVHMVTIAGGGTIIVAILARHLFARTELWQVIAS